MITLGVALPEFFSLECANDIIQSIHAQYLESLKTPYSRVSFSFEDCKYISPTGLIYLQMWKDRLLERGVRVEYWLGNREHRLDDRLREFLERIKFIPGIRSNEKEEAYVFHRYFSELHRCQNIEECSRVHQDIITNVVDSGKVNKETRSAIDYMLNELWDNAAVHGYECYQAEKYPKPVYMCAVEQGDNYEICIGDRGQGIFNSLRKNNPDFKSASKNACVLAAIKNGISGHPVYSPGFGLYSASEFIKKGNGSLYIWTSKCYLVVTAKTNRIYRSAFNEGTIVSFVVSKDADIPFSTMMSEQTHIDYSAEEYLDMMIGGNDSG